MRGSPGTWILSWLLVAAAAAAAGAEDPPDIVVILADDLGIGDLSCYGADAVRTPNLDGIAERGARFTSAYAPSPVCSPTRYAMLTGRYPWRDGVTTFLQPGAHSTIPPRRETLASYLRAMGYATAAFGKWHLGFGSPESPDPLAPGPLEAGFDRFLGWTAKAGGEGAHWIRDRRHVGWVDGTMVELTAESPPAIAVASPRSLSSGLLSGIDEFLRDAAGRPVFLWIATQQVHKPWSVSPTFQRGASGRYAACIAELDWLVGEILERLEAAGRGDALVLFASDNGAGAEAVKVSGAGHRPNDGLRGHKGSLWEGGIRVPLLVQWPTALPGGTVRSDPVSLVDVAATVLAALGDDDGAALGHDGRDLLRPPAADAAPERFVIAVSSGARSAAIRRGEWKLVRRSGEAPLLFDLERDPAETADLTGERPGVAAELEGLLAESGVPPVPRSRN